MKTIRESLVSSCPEVSGTDNDYKVFFSLVDTEQKRKDVLLGLTDREDIREAILKRHYYFENGLIHVFNAAIRLGKIPHPVIIAAWKGNKKVRNIKIRGCLLQLYTGIIKDRNLWEAMFLAYTSLDGLDAFND